MSLTPTGNTTPAPEVSSAEAARPAPKQARLKFITWKDLSILGHIEFLKVSYAVLVLLPFAAWMQHEFTTLPPVLRHMPFILRLLYFASLLLSLAHMVYQGWCPPIIKRFDSPNDLYRALLEIKALQSQYLSSDSDFGFSIKHCRENFERYNQLYWFARLVCGTFYVAGAGLFLTVVALQALRLFGVYWGV